jgi:hypothetical protein
MVCQTEMQQGSAASSTAPGRQDFKPLKVAPGSSGKAGVQGKDDKFDIVFDAPGC